MLITLPPIVTDRLDRLDQLRKPLIVRAITLILCFCLFLIGLHVSSLVASRQGQLADTSTGTANMARALASHAERSIKTGEAILGELVERAEFEQLGSVDTARLHTRMQDLVASTPEIQELFVYAADGTRLVTSCRRCCPAVTPTANFSATTSSTPAGNCTSANRSEAARAAS